MRRIQSASSINTYKQCPRKYFYRYNLKLPDEPGIYAIRGNIVHSALENFFKIDASKITDPKKDLPVQIGRLLDKYWIENKEKLKSLKMPLGELNDFYVDSGAMLKKWISRFLVKVNATNLPFTEAFKNLSPLCEAEFNSKDLGVRGFVDAIYELDDGVVKILDYKTSRKDIISPEYRLQAGIYCVLYQEEHGVLPEIVAFDFLKGEVREILVDEQLITDTMFEIEQIHVSTESDKECDYKKNPSGLCKWTNARGSGQCAYFDICKPRG